MLRRLNTTSPLGGEDISINVLDGYTSESRAIPLDYTQTFSAQVVVEDPGVDGYVQLQQSNDFNPQFPDDAHWVDGYVQQTFAEADLPGRDSSLWLEVELPTAKYYKFVAINTDTSDQGLNLNVVTKGDETKG